MIVTRTTLLLSLGLVFATGLTVGALGHRYYALQTVRAQTPVRHDPEAWRKRFVQEMTTRLTLSAAQTQQLESILDATRDKFRTLRERSRPEESAIREAQVRAIEGILSPQQQAEYAKLRQELEERKKRWEARKQPPKS